MSRLLALDIEGTLIISNAISGKVIEQLKFFSNSGWIIALVTAAYGCQLEKYKGLLEKHGSERLIDSYSPLGSNFQDSKYEKLEKYRAQYELASKENVYFFDDALSNILDVQSEGYLYSFHITLSSPLELHLERLRRSKKIILD